MTTVSYKERVEATKRIKLKRYLAMVNVRFDVNAPTQVLRALVVGLHRERVKKFGRPKRAWPMTWRRLEVLANDCHNVKNLIAMKLMWGPAAALGCIADDGKVVHCRTIADLIRIGFSSPKMAFIDDHLHLLPSWPEYCNIRSN